MKRFGAFVASGVSGEDAGRCADECWQFWHACAVVFPLENQSRLIMMSLHDVMRISCAIEGGNYKRESTTEPWGCHLGILVLSIQVC